ncbi:MAG: response regulator [Lachnospiraceae bacterium]|nr:response regulator [Lachnospiraceae bacterium]
MKSLRTKMTIMIVLAVFGSSVLLSFISYQRAKSSLITQMEDNYEVAAQKYALELTSWINTNGTIIDTLAAEIAVNGISDEGYDTFHEYLKRSNELLNKNGYVYDVYFTYPDNFMVCASDFMSDGTVDFVHEREWYTTSALTGELFIAAPYLDSDTKKPIITISKAVYRDGRLLGVLAADIFVDVLVDMVNNADVEENSYAFLIDQKMRMLIHPNTAYAYEDVPMKVMDAPAAPYQELINAINTGSTEMIMIDDYDGVERGVSYAQMDNTGWYVCIATSRAEISKGVSSLINGFVIATIVSIAIGALISIFLARVLDQLNRQEQEYKQQVLRLEKQAADEASKAKSRFLADMSHEIRTPINAIIGMNEMILRESDDRDIKGYAGNIKQSGNNLLQLINGILDFSKIEDGKMEIVPVRYSVSSQIAYYINAISDRAHAKGLKLDFDIDPGIPSELFGDDTRINQVVINLLTNAVKYTEKGSVTLRIREKERKDGNILLYFEVKDTGIGIKESDMARLFESFERLDVVKNRNIEGTGLGMAITRKLLELMGSELKVESEYGKGSIFSFDLLQRIEDDKPLGDYNKAIRETGNDDRYKESFHAPDAHILVVDDTNMNLLVIKNLLKKTDIKIDTALNGPDSINLADKNAYDVILMDQRMPGMDGTEAMQKIKSAEKGLNAETPVICLTADVIRGAKDRYMKTGFDDYLSKPVDGDELEKMLIKYLPADKVNISRTADDTMSVETDKTPETVEIPETVETRQDDPLMTALEAAGVDTEIGRKYCGNEDEMYRSVLETYAADAKSKSLNIQNSFKAMNWKDYGTYVHSLKSASKAIGAKELSELAAGLEAAAGAEDLSFINENHDRVILMYEKLAGLIRENSHPDGLKEHDENVILEFTPG